MDVDAFLDEIRTSPGYRGQIVHVHEMAARAATFARDEPDLSDTTRRMLAAMGVERLYSHQAEAVAAAMAGRDVLVVTGTASGKSLCYVAPIVETLQRHPDAGALMLFPTKALCQDQYQQFRRCLAAGGLDTFVGVCDGDTPPATRRKLRDRASVIFTNPDMLHAAIMPQHARWARFLSSLRYLVLDELHVYNGIFGANMANMLRRFERLCAHSHRPRRAPSDQRDPPRRLARRPRQETQEETRSGRRAEQCGVE
jgi:DEAD/DEAH box helicase domain-containing protein